MNRPDMVEDVGGMDEPEVVAIKRRNTTHWKAVAKAAERLAGERLAYIEQLRAYGEASRIQRQEAVSRAERFAWYARSGWVLFVLALAYAVTR